MPQFHDILFEVSSETRYDILRALSEGPSVVTDVSEGLGISLTEASRHFNRLAQLELIAKRVDGPYVLTLLGKTILIQLKSLEFTSKHTSYFNTHNMTLIPERFQNTIYELEAASPSYAKRVNVMRISGNVGKVAAEAEKYVLGIVDEEIMEFVFYAKPEEGTYQLVEDALKRDVKYRVIFPKSFSPDKLHKEAFDLQAKSIKAGNFEYRVIDPVDVFIHMSEKEASILSFPDENGLFDYLGFEAKDARSLNWCKELFEYYWDRAQPVNLI